MSQASNVDLLALAFAHAWNVRLKGYVRRNSDLDIKKKLLIQITVARA